MQKVKFINKNQAVVHSELRKRVDAYFKENNLLKTGGRKMILKAIVMLSLYLVPYFFIVFSDLHILAKLGLSMIMGLGVAGTGMSVMHDAIHGSFSEKKWVNTLFGGSLYLLGGNVDNWDVQHNQLHHTYTNIHEIDEDITGKFLLRLNIAEKLKSIHKFQHIYAFFLYSLMTISFLWKDFKEIGLFKRMSKEGLVKPLSTRQLTVLAISKLVYVLFIFVVPVYVGHISIGHWAIGFFTMHILAGLILATVFQLAHVVEDAHQAIPNTASEVASSWAVHQLETTSNFNNRKLLSWYIGGLDFQIEHHLFPKISHIHYPALSKIVEKTATEFGVYYNSKGSFRKALNSHIQMLKMLGTQESIRFAK